MAKVEVDIAEYDQMRSQLKQLESDKIDLALQLDRALIENKELKKVKQHYIIKTINRHQVVDRSKVANILLIKILKIRNQRPISLDDRDMIEQCINECSYDDYIEFSSTNESVPEIDLEKFKDQLALEMRDEVRAEYEETVSEYEEFNKNYESYMHDLKLKELSLNRKEQDYQYQLKSIKERKTQLEKEFNDNMKSQLEVEKKLLDEKYLDEIKSLKSVIETTKKTIDSLNEKLNTALENSQVLASKLTESKSLIGIIKTIFK